MHTLRQLRVKIFADGADLSGMLDMYRKPHIKGFTTNPTLMRKAGIRDYRAFARDVIAAIPDRPISFEVFADEFDEMARQATEIGGWGDYAGGDAPGLSFHTATWLHERQIAAVATDTWGMEVRPNEIPNTYQPLHQVLIPNMGLLVGEIFDLDGLAEDCARDGVYEFQFVAPPLPVTGAVGTPVNPLAIK